MLERFGLACRLFYPAEEPRAISWSSRCARRAHHGCLVTVDPLPLFPFGTREFRFRVFFCLVVSLPRFLSLFFPCPVLRYTGCSYFFFFAIESLHLARGLWGRDHIIADTDASIGQLFFGDRSAMRANDYFSLSPYPGDRWLPSPVGMALTAWRGEPPAGRVSWGPWG